MTENNRLRSSAPTVGHAPPVNPDRPYGCRPDPGSPPKPVILPKVTRRKIAPGRQSNTRSARRHARWEVLIGGARCGEYFDGLLTPTNRLWDAAPGKMCFDSWSDCRDYLEGIIRSKRWRTTAPRTTKK